MLVFLGAGARFALVKCVSREGCLVQSGWLCSTTSQPALSRHNVAGAYACPLKQERDMRLCVCVVGVRGGWEKSARPSHWEVNEDVNESRCSPLEAHSVVFLVLGLGGPASQVPSVSHDSTREHVCWLASLFRGLRRLIAPSSTCRSQTPCFAIYCDPYLSCLPAFLLLPRECVLGPF